MSEQTKTVGLFDFISEAYFQFGNYVNTQRQIPSVFDGLKPVYRRVIYSTYTFGLGRFQKTATIGGDVIGKYHPHGDASVYPVVSNLVNSGYLTGQGDHGFKELDGTVSPPAAPRYSEARMNKDFYKMLDLLMKYVPFNQSDLNYPEPDYIPTPVPLCLTFGAMGLGIGFNVRVPAFSFKSLFNAILHDDYNLLEAPDGLTLDKDNSDLEEFWLTGRGNIAYKLNTEYVRTEEGEGYRIWGNPLMFTPGTEDLDEWVDEGQIFYRQSFHNDWPCITVMKAPYVRKINIDELGDIVENMASWRKKFYLRVSDGKNIYPIGLREWLSQTFNRYLDLLKSYQESNLISLKKEKSVYQWIPFVVKALNEDDTLENEDLIEMFDGKLPNKNMSPLDEETLTSIFRKQLGTLRRTDFGPKLAEIESGITKFTAMDPLTEIKSIVDDFGK